MQEGGMDDQRVGVMNGPALWKLLNDWPKSPSEIDVDIANFALGPSVIRFSCADIATVMHQTIETGSI